MAAVGILAAGVAHEMNNPLAYVSANLEFALKALEDSHKSGAAIAPDEVNVALAEATQGVDRLRHVIRDLKAFSRADESKREPVELKRIIESSLNMARNEIRHRAQLKKDFAEVPPVDGNESRLGQVFLNLFVNAAQAIPDGAADKNEIRVTLRKEGADRVIVEIRDTGSGIAPEVRPQLFQPFVTTKPLGVGTGLGLSICHAIIADHGGTIEVESELGKGTTFRIKLPAAQRETVVKPVAKAYSGPTRRGRILLVDDEPMIGSAFRRTVGQEHEVVTLTRAKDALAKLSAGEQFDLVFCDLMMPEMTGMDLHAALTQTVPDVASRMIFLTGGAFTERAREFLDHIPNQRMEKPFDVTNLRSVIANMLA
jgi:CheY-like chemotaxis protein